MKKIFSFLLTACNTAATGEEKLIKENTVEKDSIIKLVVSKEGTVSKKDLQITKLIIKGENQVIDFG